MKLEKLEKPRFWKHRDVKKPSRYKGLKQQLGLNKDEDQLLECKGRLAHAELNSKTRHPILFPREHHLAKRPDC